MGDTQVVEIENKSITETFDEIVENNTSGDIDVKNIPNVKDSPVADEIDNTVTSAEKVSAIDQLMLTTLSPELGNNEEQKRNFKEGLVKYIKIILTSQLIVVGLAFITIIICVCAGVSHPSFVNNIPTIFNFMQFYITAIIVEFIAMLFFIVKFVFDKSICLLLLSQTDTLFPLSSI